MIQTTDEIQQRCLPGARRPHEREKAAFFDREVDAIEHMHRLPTLDETFDHVPTDNEI